MSKIKLVLQSMNERRPSIRVHNKNTGAFFLNGTLLLIINKSKKKSNEEIMNELMNKYAYSKDTYKDLENDIKAGIIERYKY